MPNVSSCSLQVGSRGLVVVRDEVGPEEDEQVVGAGLDQLRRSATVQALQPAETSGEVLELSGEEASHGKRRGRASARRKPASLEPKWPRTSVVDRCRPSFFVWPFARHPLYSVALSVSVPLLPW